MADIKTHLRELSVATTIGLLNLEIDFKLPDLYNSRRFLAYAKKVIDSDISYAENLYQYANFTDDLQCIINNGYKLGKKIFDNPYFKINKNCPIHWLGYQTQKGDPIDIAVGEYGFSLKEESFILKNMGLYSFLNNLTGMHYPKGLHVFSKFAPKKYDAWFHYTWNYLINYLKQNKDWKFSKKQYCSQIMLSKDEVILAYNNKKAKVPINISTASAFQEYTTSVIREKVFSKWIRHVIAENDEYIRLKNICSKAAGKRVCETIQNNYSPENVYEFFQINDKEYYYAKTTSTETTILRIPGHKDFHYTIEFQGCRYEVPKSQLNIITTFKNTHTNKCLDFRNECRFSHGQFNGTPEAKMYVDKNTPLTALYESLD